MVIGSVQRYCMRTCRWSCRSAPTPGMSATTSMPMRAQQLGRAEPGELQQLRRVERAAGQDHLAAGVRDARRAAVPVFDADRAPALEQDAAGQRVGLDRQIGPPPRLPQIADRGRPAPAVLAR